MVDGISLRLREEALEFFERPELPGSFAFYDSLSPVNQRLFAVELWGALSRALIADPYLSGPAPKFVEFVEAWKATAELDSAPEVVDEIRRPKEYRPLAGDDQS